MPDPLDDILTLPPAATPPPGLDAGAPPVPAAPILPGGVPGSGEALINMADAFTPLLCRMWARKYHVKWTRAAEAAAKLNKDERATLALVADSAAQFIPALLAHAPKIAAVIFVFLWYSMLTDRRDMIAALAPAPKTPEKATGEELERRRKNHEPTGLPRGRPKKNAE
jgi:hypothetical protein